jgi:hypothetical protein
MDWKCGSKSRLCKQEALSSNCIPIQKKNELKKTVDGEIGSLLGTTCIISILLSEKEKMLFSIRRIRLSSPNL